MFVFLPRLTTARTRESLRSRKPQTNRCVVLCFPEESVCQVCLRDYTVGKENGLKLYPVSVVLSAFSLFMSIFDEWKLDNSLECSQLEIYKKAFLLSSLWEFVKKKYSFTLLIKLKKMAWDIYKKQSEREKKRSTVKQWNRFLYAWLDLAAVSHAGKPLGERFYLGGK